MAKRSDADVQGADGRGEARRVSASADGMPLGKLIATKSGRAEMVRCGEVVLVRLRTGLGNWLVQNNAAREAVDLIVSRMGAHRADGMTVFV